MLKWQSIQYTWSFFIVIQLMAFAVNLSVSDPWSSRFGVHILVGSPLLQPIYVTARSVSLKSDAKGGNFVMSSIDIKPSLATRSKVSSKVSKAAGLSKCTLSS